MRMGKKEKQMLKEPNSNFFKNSLVVLFQIIEYFFLFIYLFIFIRQGFHILLILLYILL